jgi:hypothetical protein
MQVIIKGGVKRFNKFICALLVPWHSCAAANVEVRHHLQCQFCYTAETDNASRSDCDGKRT